MSALPLRRRLLPAAAAAEAAAADQPSALAQLAASGAKPTKTAVSKLTVAELRAECELLGLPADGLKAGLVERLLGWWEAQRQQPGATQQAQPAAAPSVASAPAAVPPSSSEEGAGERLQAQREAEIQRYQQQQQQQPPQQPGGQGQESDEEEGQRQGREQQQRKRVPGVPWMSVTWLGTSSGNPTTKRNVSAIAGEGRAPLRCAWPCSAWVYQAAPAPALLLAVLPRIDCARRVWMPWLPSGPCPLACLPACRARAQPAREQPPQGRPLDSVPSLSYASVQYGDDMFLVDAGEGTRHQVRRPCVEAMQVGPLWLPGCIPFRLRD